MRSGIRNFFQRFSWQQAIVLALLLLFEVSMHPLGLGPDRRIHDPAVARAEDPSAYRGDWYTEMAVESQVYTYYAELVQLGPTLGISEEAWRMLLYLLCLSATYIAMLGIARLFTQSPLVIPSVVFFHALLMLVAPPIWLYGPFIHIDGGLAPRSVGMALSFVALFSLLKGSRVLPWALLGIATLIHVSNSLIVFTLFLAAWVLREGIRKWGESLREWKRLMGETVFIGVVYIATGGWFAALVALSGGEEAAFMDAQFIWSWIYFRAPYMALPLIRWEAWLLSALHALALGIAWFILSRWQDRWRPQLNLLGLVGIAGIAYFFAFYFFAFAWPWLPGFQFYSIRVVYLTHFVTYLFSALVLIEGIRRFGFPAASQFLGAFPEEWWKAAVGGVLMLVLVGGFLATPPGEKYQAKAQKNLEASWTYFADPEAREVRIGSPVVRELARREEPFLAPAHWFGSPLYLPHAASFKTFGFTPEGLEEWFRRMDDLSHSELSRTYQEQMTSGEFEPVMIDWNAHYARLTPAEAQELSDKYGFELFLTFQTLSYPFPLLAEDGEYRLYLIPEKR